MISNDATILNIKHEVLYEVAKLAFAGTLEERKEELPFEMIPGPKARFRCCVYKEREVIRQRIALAEGKPPLGKQSDNIVQVIDAACEDCPISRFVVTDNCQKCMGKACQQSCRFDAIEMGRERAHIDPAKCKECGKCAQACPYNAIADLIRPCRRSCPVDAIKIHPETGLATIDERRCINCGACIHRCPFGAISSRSFIVDVIRAITGGKRVIALVAPATEGQFGPGITMQSWRTALQKAGFTDMVEVALGADLTAASEAEEWAEAYAKGEKKTTSCCPAFVSYIKKNFPKLEQHISHNLSPMAMIAKVIKRAHPDSKIVFIGPCVAKKGEQKQERVRDLVDVVITFEELQALMDAYEIDMSVLEDDVLNNASYYGRVFARSGGVRDAVEEVLRELEIKPEQFQLKPLACSGLEECKLALLKASKGILEENFIEGMACEQGCIGGPGCLTHGPKEKAMVDKYGRLALEKKVKDAVVIFDVLGGAEE